jgi:hypothetical protein
MGETSTIGRDINFSGRSSDTPRVRMGMYRSRIIDLSAEKSDEGDIRGVGGRECTTSMCLEYL